MQRSLVIALLAVLTGLAAFLAASCAGDWAGTPRPLRSAGEARTVVSPAGGAPPITITSVVPAVGPGAWLGTTVLLDYSRATGDVDLARSRLNVNGRPQPARISWTAISPASFVVIFAWEEPYPPGDYVFSAELGTTGGGVILYEWMSTTR